MQRWWQRVRGALGRAIAPHPTSPGDGPPEADRPPAALAPRPARGLGPQVLVDALAHPDPNVRAAAARKLGELGPQFEAVAVPALTRALSDPDEGVRSSAALSLGTFGAKAAAAVPALVEALGDPDDDVRSSAGLALEDIGPPAHTALEAALAHPDERVRSEAAIILRHLQGRSRET